MGQISLSLVSHTNAGKTTLARTLLGRDIGEVRDAAHVTEFADAFTMIETADGDALRLWDTPGFGDSVRLARRLHGATQPLGWFLSEVWDRWRDRPFWATQQALRNVRDEADVMLYLVNAAEAPAAAGYVAPELALLGWIGKPVIVLLNQLGSPGEPAGDAADVARWRAHLAPLPQVQAVLPLDAFARCWVQELTLLEAVERSLPAAQRAAMARLRAAWQSRRLATFDAAIGVLAESLARTASARQSVPEGAGVRGALRQLGTALRGGGGAGADDGRLGSARAALNAGLDAELRASTTELIVLHGLEGRAGPAILARLASHYEARLKLGEGTAAVWGGMVTGALTGLKADVLSGGLTLGGGLLLGGVLGAFGGAGIARGYNLVRGNDSSWLAWSGAALDPMVDAALLRYLAVAHFGRGRGDWTESDAPAHWRTVVEAALAPERATLTSLWAGRERRRADGPPHEQLGAALQPLLRRAALASLEALYPGRLRTGDAGAAH